MVTYIYGASQAMALLAPSSKTPFDPQSLDLPSMGALIVFYHACSGFPVKQTWLDAIKVGNFDTFDGLTYSNAARYCLHLDETILGHLAQQCQNIRSTKPTQHVTKTAIDPVSPSVNPAAPSNKVHIHVVPISKL